MSCKPGGDSLLTGIAADKVYLLARALWIPRHCGQRDPGDRGQATSG